MKAENSRLGRCGSCRHWKSAQELVTERAGPTPSAAQLERARQSVRDELSFEYLDIRTADQRGWCLAAESGRGSVTDMLAVNPTTGEPARLITRQGYGCLNHQPRPHKAMSVPPADLSRNPRLGRCASCRHWSSAKNEAAALLSIERYTNANARLEDAQREAYALLSPPPLNPNTAGSRGWCKASANDRTADPGCLAVNPASGTIGGVITSESHACITYIESIDPRLTTRPDWRWTADRTKAHSIGPSVSLNELLWSYLDPGALLDESCPLSPLHPEHPLNLRNPRSLYYNPNPAFAAFRVRPHLVKQFIQPQVFEGDTSPHRKRPSSVRWTPTALPTPTGQFGLPPPSIDLPAAPAVKLSKTPDQTNPKKPRANVCATPTTQPTLGGGLGPRKKR